MKLKINLKDYTENATYNSVSLLLLSAAINGHGIKDLVSDMTIISMKP
jgi:hypothetical protein